MIEIVVDRCQCNTGILLFHLSEKIFRRSSASCLDVRIKTQVWLESEDISSPEKPMRSLH